MVFGWSDGIVYGLLIASVAAYGFYCQSLGRPLLIFLCIIMMPLATTELGTDGAITGIMLEPMQEAGWSPLWVLIYTSAIMTILRFFFAGPIVKKLTPIGLLAVSAGLAVVGLFLLSTAEGMFVIFASATLYGLGKTFFWPTTLGVVSEQCPKGGALTLNAIAGIGMLTVGIVGGPLIGKMQEDSAIAALTDKKADVVEKVSVKREYFLGEYTAVDAEKVAGLDEDQDPEKESAIVSEVKTIVKEAKQSALANVTVFPAFMLVCYIALGVYFKGRGGYKAVELDANDGADSQNEDSDVTDDAGSSDEDSESSGNDSPDDSSADSPDDDSGKKDG
jgi:hypothetical protein